MANRVWNGTGGVAGKLTDNGNWDGVAPGAGDVGIFNAGSQSVDPNLGQIAAMAGLEIYPGYGGAIGAVSNKMTCSITAVRHVGLAALWLDDSAGITTDVFIRPVNNNVIVNLGGDTMTNVTILRGNVTIASTIGTIALLEVGYVANRENDAVVTIVSGATAVTAGQEWGGQITCSAEIATHRQCAGTITLPVGSGGDVGTILQAGGRFYHYSTATIDLLHAGGLVDLGQAAKTITKSARYPGGTIIKSETIHTFTNPTVDLAEVA